MTASAPTPPSGSASPVLPLPLVRRGKVRDVYELPPDPRKPADGPRLLLVASDRISAFDVVMPTPIEGKGRVLTAMSAFWFGFIGRLGLCQTHVLSTSTDDIPFDLLPANHTARGWLNGRITIGRKCSVIPIECVVRGYLEGSGWKEYQATGSVCGVQLPKGLKQCDRLPEPIFTPATKAATGHDENISFEQACDAVGIETMSVLRDTSIAIYTAAARHAQERGIIIADTKFEFGFEHGAEQRMGRVFEQPILIDEALTPDSSRFWPADEYQPGRPQRSYDKQFLREYLESLVAAGKWDKTDPGPVLPPEVVQGTLARYREALAKLCG
ncbi:MAG: phosphoribosylaminoimidazolesuccinocarboxamide synthase [Planctomycetaceae bacterium]|jgi:phosphoribosylaminoimidazole-succinocarboxamide synthase|nr:phosphoribosylaminoimidazolesuccinocarboxamide synthase [Phycisphaerales bacterium]MCE2652835.1 phosphoribosylaminoimidazolesuccinocarboxamide synthase [Planctomycetaceae bacterium]